MKRIIMLAMVLVMLVSIGGCWWDPGGRGGGHDRGEGHERDGGHDRDGGYDRDHRHERGY